MKKGPTKPRPWQPMVKGSVVRNAVAEKIVAEQLERGELTPEQAHDLLNPELWKNDRYTAHVRRHVDGWVLHISFRRNDRKPARDWRDVQRIKNDIAGPDVEGVELYPAESRLVDQANQYHVWCLPPGKKFPFGFENGRVVKDADDPEVVAIGAKQRPLDRPEGEEDAQG